MKKVLGLAVLALAISACDDSDSNSSAATPTPTPTPGASPTPSPSPDPSGSPTPTPTPGESPEPTPAPTFGDKGACFEPVNPAMVQVTDVIQGVGCVACGVENPDGVTDENPENYAVMSSDLSLLGAGGMSDISLTLTLGEVIDPTVVPTDENGNAIGEAADHPGFVVSFPTPALEGLSIAPSLVVETLLGDELVEFADYPFGFGEVLALGGIHNGLLLDEINDAQVYLSVDATQPYDEVRISLTAQLASLLLSVNLHSACIAGVPGSIEGDY